MPKLTPETMEARRRAILLAARRCFARKGFHATTISELCSEAGVSAGGLYTHFADKHAIAAAIGEQATQGGAGADLMEKFSHLLSAEGGVDARLDLHLWAGSISDPVLHQMVIGAFDQLRQDLVRVSGAAPGSPRVAMLEALALGLEVQRALGRTSPDGLPALLHTLLHAESL